MNDHSNELTIEYYISYKKLIYKHYNKLYAVLMLLLTYLKLFKIFIIGKGST